jgi:20S proteasome subunit alpha 6
MRTECLDHRFVHDDKPLPAGNLVSMIASSKISIFSYFFPSESQLKTQRYSRRPFGVGLLVGAVDAAGTHIYETCPSGNYYEYKVNAGVHLAILLSFS